MSKITVSRDEAAEALSVDVQTIDRLIAAKKLKASKVGRRVLIRVAALEAMLDDTTVQ
jgi:excisionase family DNA binding protein